MATVGWHPEQTATHWRSKRGPLPHLPTAADAAMSGGCNICQGRRIVWDRNRAGSYRPWVCPVCNGTGRP